MGWCRKVIENVVVQIGSAISSKDYTHQFDALQRTLKEHHSNLMYAVPETVNQGSYKQSPFFGFQTKRRKEGKTNNECSSFVHERIQTLDVSYCYYWFPGIPSPGVRRVQTEEIGLAQEVSVDGRTFFRCLHCLSGIFSLMRTDIFFSPTGIFFASKRLQPARGNCIIVKEIKSECEWKEREKWKSVAPNRVFCLVDLWGYIRDVLRSE